MKAPFSESANSIFWISLAAAIVGVVAAPLGLLAWARTPYASGTDDQRTQPIKFDHRHHVRDDGIDCLYCHAGATRSSHAGVPATSICMGCHNQIWTASPELTRVRASAFETSPIHWARVASLPDYVFFDHSIHLSKGVGCVTCHGRVDEMAQTYAPVALTMSFCIDCHRDPGKHLRPPEKLTDMDWKPAGPEVGPAIAKAVGARSIVDCSGCHR